MILSHYFPPLPATFLKSLLLEDASYFFLGEYTVGPLGVRSGSRLCAAASCLSGRKREKGRMQGEEDWKTCTMFDQRGAESHQDGSRDQGFSQPNCGRRDSMGLLRSKASAGVVCFQSVFKGARADSELKHS